MPEVGSFSHIEDQDQRRYLIDEIVKAHKERKDKSLKDYLKGENKKLLVAPDALATLSYKELEALYTAAKRWNVNEGKALELAAKKLQDSTALDPKIATAATSKMDFDPTSSPVYTSHMADPKFKEYLDTLKQESKRAFEENVLPRLQQMYMRQGAQGSNAANNAFVRLETKREEQLNRDILKELHQRSAEGKTLALDTNQHQLAGIQNAYNLNRQELADKGRRIEDAQRVHHNILSDKVAAIDAINKGGVARQNAAQARIDADVKNWKEERDEPFQMAAEQGYAATQVPVAAQAGPFGTSAPAPTLPVNPANIGAGLLMSYAGLNPAQNQQQQKAEGGEVQAIPQQPLDPTQMEMLQIARQMSSPRGDPMRRMLATMGANILANPTGDTFASIGKGLQEHHKNEAERERHEDAMKGHHISALNMIQQQRQLQQQLLSQDKYNMANIALKQQELKAQMPLWEAHGEYYKSQANKTPQIPNNLITHFIESQNLAKEAKKGKELAADSLNILDHISTGDVAARARKLPFGLGEPLGANPVRSVLGAGDPSLLDRFDVNMQNIALGETKRHGRLGQTVAGLRAIEASKPGAEREASANREILSAMEKQWDKDIAYAAQLQQAFPQLSYLARPDEEAARGSSHLPVMPNASSAQPDLQHMSRDELIAYRKRLVDELRGPGG